MLREAGIVTRRAAFEGFRFSVKGSSCSPKVKLSDILLRLVWRGEGEGSGGDTWSRRLPRIGDPTFSGARAASALSCRFLSRFNSAKSTFPLRPPADDLEGLSLTRGVTELAKLLGCSVSYGRVLRLRDLQPLPLLLS